jgi:outer membrane PBP1 activator LpoA protein
MLIKSLKGLLAAAALAALGGCSTPCDAPGRLCAPVESNTSVPVARAQAAGAPAAAGSEASVQTMAVDSPSAAAAAGKPPANAVRIGLMLPLRSAALGPPSEALRAGFMAAYERDGSGFMVNLIETGDSAQDALDAYAAAVAQNDIVVGPLARSAVSAVAASTGARKPTVALNHPEQGIPVPQQMLVMGLSIEDEARQVAALASSEQPGANALIVSGTSAWQRRLAGAFAAEWARRGRLSQLVEIPAYNGYLSEAAIGQLKLRVETELPNMMFAALDADQARQVRAIIGPDLPFYGAASVNPGIGPGTAATELDGVRLLDLPWVVQPDHPAVMVYPRWSGERRTLDMDRLYALGIDAFRVAREIALKPGASFTMDGVTGRLSVRQGQGAARFERVVPAAVYQGGTLTLIPAGR